jgi:hypothetical protein
MSALNALRRAGGDFCRFEAQLTVAVTDFLRLPQELSDAAFGMGMLYPAGADPLARISGPSLVAVISGNLATPRKPSCIEPAVRRPVIGQPRDIPVADEACVGVPRPVGRRR